MITIGKQLFVQTFLPCLGSDDLKKKSYLNGAKGCMLISVFLSEQQQGTFCVTSF